MLVYSLKKAALPPPTKQPPGTLVQNSHQNSEKLLKEVGRSAFDSKHQANGMGMVGHGKNNNLAQLIKSDNRPGETKVQAPVTVVPQPSNGVAHPVQPKKEAPQTQVQNFSLELPLRKTLSTPTAPSEHPLFGKLTSFDTNHQAEPKSRPCWYLNGDQPSQLQKRKPEDASSRTSSSKKLVRPQHSGLQRLKEMSKKIRLLDEFSSLRVSRVNSTELPRASHRQEMMAGFMQA